MCFVVARVLFIWLMPATYSRDMFAWLRVMEILKEKGNPYALVGSLNWPPFWMVTLFGVKQLAQWTHISETHTIQAVLIAGEAITLGLTYLTIKRFFATERLIPVLLFGLALNPISILLSCQHGNFDVFVGMWVLATVYMLLEYNQSDAAEHWLMACFCLGMGIFTKTIPFILIPLLVPGFVRQRWMVRFFGALMLFVPVAIGMAVIYALATEGVTNCVLNYRSMPGWYGITGLLNLAKAISPIFLYQSIAPYLMVSLMLLFSWRNIKRKVFTSTEIVVTALLLLVFVPTFGPGYSPPYINWFLPLLVIFYVASPPTMKRFLVTGYVVVGLTYCVEYAWYPSLGGFWAAMNPSPRVAELSEYLGAQLQQVVIRIPMFLFFVALYCMLVRYLYQEDKAVVSVVSTKK